MWKLSWTQARCSQLSAQSTTSSLLKLAALQSPRIPSFFSLHVVDHTRLKASILEYHVLKSTLCHMSSQPSPKNTAKQGVEEIQFLNAPRISVFLHRSHHKQHTACFF